MFFSDPRSWIVGVGVGWSQPHFGWSVLVCIEADFVSLQLTANFGESLTTYKIHTPLHRAKLNRCSLSLHLIFSTKDVAEFYGFFRHPARDSPTSVPLPPPRNFDGIRTELREILDNCREFLLQKFEISRQN